VIADQFSEPAREIKSPQLAETPQQPASEPSRATSAQQTEAQSILPRGGPETAREQLEPAPGEEAAYADQNRIAPHIPTGPFAFMNGRHPDDIRSLLRDEHPQTVAVIAAQLPPVISAAVLAGFPPDVQADVLQRVAKLGPTDPEILADVASELKERLGQPRVRAGGVSQAAAVLRESSRATTRSMLSTLDDRDSDLADELRQTLFSFDDLLQLDDETLRVVLQETDDRQWALALKASPEAVRQKVLACLPARVAQAFKAEMDSLGPVRLSEMTTVRQQIADSIHRLEEEGLITLPVR
jgi:flagellar motor switch protein FliG